MQILISEIDKYLYFMSISQQQQIQAKIFLASYRNAIKILQNSAEKINRNEQYQTFLSDITRIKYQKGAKFQSYWSGDEHKYSGIEIKDWNLDKSIERKMRLFKFHQYTFLKYLTGFDNATDFNAINKVLQEGIKKLQNDFK